MKQPSELRADKRAATHRNLYCRRSVFRSALDATFPPVVSTPKSLATRHLRPSISRQTSDVFGDRTTRGMFGKTRLSKCRFKVKMSDSLYRRDHAFSGSLHSFVSEASV